MANFCEYKCIVKGPRNACYAVFGSMSCLDNKEIVEEKQLKNGNWYVRFEGYCKWSVDSYCSELVDQEPFVIPEDLDEAYQFGEDHWGIVQRQKPTLFGVEFLCNSADIEDYEPDWYDECGGFYEHYRKDGTPVFDRCPKKLYIRPDWLDDDENFNG